MFGWRDKNYYDSGYKFLYLDIDSFKGCIMNKMTESLGHHLESIENELKLVDDYIFLCFLLGNDF